MASKYGSNEHKLNGIQHQSDIIKKVLIFLRSKGYKVEAEPASLIEDRRQKLDCILKFDTSTPFNGKLKRIWVMKKPDNTIKRNESYISFLAEKVLEERKNLKEMIYKKNGWKLKQPNSVSKEYSNGVGSIKYMEFDVMSTPVGGSIISYKDFSETYFNELRHYYDGPSGKEAKTELLLNSIYDAIILAYNEGRKESDRKDNIINYVKSEHDKIIDKLQHSMNHLNNLNKELNNIQ